MASWVCRLSATVFPVILLAGADLQAQEEIPIAGTECVYRPSTRIEPLVSAEVDKDPPASLRFSYRLRNGTGGVQAIWSFDVVTTGGATSLQAPGAWRGSFFKYKPISGWAEVSENRDLVVRPGQEVSGFRLESGGLPSIVSCWTQGKDLQGKETGVWCPDGGVPQEDIPYADFFNDSVKGTTVGPVPKPTTFDPNSFLGTITDLKNQSLALGWIKDEAASAELGSRLSAISGQLSAMQGQTIPVTTGRAVLELAAQFMQYVESNSCKEFECAESRPLTAEGYALMYFNMDYFATQVAKACNLPAPQVSPSPQRKPKAAGKK